jgi:predicted tellurium resistance membrane protein TerC
MKFSEVLVVSFSLFIVIVGMNILIENTLPLGVIIFSTVISLIMFLLVVLIVGSWVKEYREEKKRKSRTY